MLTRLDSYNIRNLETVRLAGLGCVSVFFGENGSGKTSLLEAIHMLGMARSFRTNSARSVIRHGESACTVYGELSQGQAGDAVLGLGVERQRSGLATLKVSGQPVRTVSRFALRAPRRPPAVSRLGSVPRGTWLFCGMAAIPAMYQAAQRTPAP
jgi:DNA replication and repair protein RecF